jgi:hypothetical protein
MVTRSLYKLQYKGHPTAGSQTVDGQLPTAILILEKQVPRIVEAAGNIPHDGKGSGHGARKPLDNNLH